MDGFSEYIEKRIKELSEEEKRLEEGYRQDDAVFVKIKSNVYDVCRTVLGVFEKIKSEDTLYNEYIKKLDEFEKNLVRFCEKDERIRRRQESGG